MSLDRFTNITEIRETPGLTRGISWPQQAIELLELDEIKVRPDDTPIVEVHIYTPTNETYLGGGPITDFVIQGEKIYIDYVKVFANLNIKRGFFKVLVNVYYDVIGTYEYPILKITDISADGRELLLDVFRPRAEANVPEDIIATFLQLYPKATDRDFALNFGENEILRIINHKSYLNENVLAVRTLTPLPSNFAELSRCNLIELVSDSWVDNISLDQLAPTPALNTLRGPNFEIDSGYTMVTETDFLNWNQLLGSNLGTSQKIIDSFFSGSITGVELGIDYTAFPEFVYYSSAADRVSGFKAKLENIEYYNNRLSLLNSTSGSSSGSLSVNVTNTTKKRDDVIGRFDAFERWLYNEPTASIYTHGITGSFTKVGVEGEAFAVSPYPKRIVNGRYELYSTTASIAETWYDTLYDAATLFDENNPYSLVKTIPQHLREDPNNSEYESFVNMIAHHFDILYTYANALTRVHIKEEHPKRGIDKDVLFDIARSQGWQLVNGNQASQLWRYKLGTNESGSFASTGSIFSQSDEAITGEVWRRIVNNLPYILKTRGTERSIKALLNIYGIPQTMLSVREYGGPMVGNEWPALTEDRYSYAVFFNSGSHIKYATNYISSSIGDWGMTRGTNNVIPVQTREFRFRPAYTGSMLLYTQLDQNNAPLTQIAIQHTGSYSGSGLYGRINVSFGRAISNIIPMTASSAWLPLFNGEFWNLRYGWYTTGLHFNTGSNTNTTYNIQVQQSSDFIRGKINFSSSIEFTPTAGNHYLVWSRPGTTPLNYVYIGGTTGSTDTFNVNTYLNNMLGSAPGTYSGSMQEYREWLEYLGNDAFDEHTFNPTSYVSYLSPSSSYDTLVRHYTLGTDIIGVALNTPGTIISSSHPNYVIKDFMMTSSYNSNAYAYGFVVPSDEQRGNFIPVEETYYIRGASLGANNPRSEKIRLEDNFLIRRLSPINTAERSSFDNAPLDSNKLGLFYSFADQVNKDVFNHIGRIELDDYIGDPDDEYELAYEDLKWFSSQYWKKFTNNSDINAFNRIFSQYDFSVFNQIKQTLPLRVDDVSGLLVEPNILERSKVQITKPIKVENPQYEINLGDVPPTGSGEANLQHEGVIDNSESTVYTPSATWQEEYLGEHSYIRYTGSMNYCTIETLPVDELRSYTASFIDSNYYVSGANSYVDTYYNNQDVLFNPTSTATTTYWKDTTVPLGQYDWQEKIIIGTGSAWLPINSVLSGGDYTDQIRLRLNSFNAYDMHIRPKIKLQASSSVTNMLYTAALVKTETDSIHSRILHVYDVVTGATVNDTLFDVQFNSVLIPAQTHLTLILQFQVPTNPIVSVVNTTVSASLYVDAASGLDFNGSFPGTLEYMSTASANFGAPNGIQTNAHDISWFLTDVGQPLYWYDASTRYFYEDGNSVQERFAAQFLSSSIVSSDRWIFLGSNQGNTSVAETFHINADSGVTLRLEDTINSSGANTWVSSSILSSPVSNVNLLLKRIVPIITIEEICHSVRSTEITECRSSDIYMKHVYHYSGSPSITNDYARNFNYAQSASNGMYYSRSLAPACYRDDFYESYERAFYIGTQLSSPRPNLGSDDNNIGRTPVVEIYEVNPNQIFYNSTPRQAGNGGGLEPGNITIR